MKSLLLIASSLQMGGLQRAVVNVSDYFVSNGYEVKILLLYKQKRFYETNKNIEIIEPARKYSKYFKFLYYIYAVIFLRKEIQRVHPNRILSFGELTNPIVLLSTLGTNFPVYISDRSSPLRKQGILIRLLSKFVYGKSKGIIAQTKIAATIKQKQYGSAVTIKVIPNILRTVKRFETERKKIILAVGRLYYIKGFDRLIKAFTLIADQCAEWNVHIIGSGPEAESLNLLIENNNLKSRILILPESKDIDLYLNSSKIFVMPSRSEGFPNALCEAMTAGLACLSFDFVAGPSEIITNETNGFLIPDGDINALAERMLQLTKNEEIRSRIGTNAQQIKEKLSYENTAKLYEDFIFAKS